MNLLFIIIGFIIGILLINWVFRQPSISNKSTDCPPHKWIIKNEGTPEEYLVCERCKILPGTDMKEEG
jgi:hypothetical protein